MKKLVAKWESFVSTLNKMDERVAPKFEKMIKNEIIIAGNIMLALSAFLLIFCLVRPDFFDLYGLFPNHADVSEKAIISYFIDSVAIILFVFFFGEYISFIDRHTSNKDVIKSVISFPSIPFLFIRKKIGSQKHWTVLSAIQTFLPISTITLFVALCSSDALLNYVNHHFEDTGTYKVRESIAYLLNISLISYTLLRLFFTPTTGDNKERNNKRSVISAINFVCFFTSMIIAAIYLEISTHAINIAILPNDHPPLSTSISYYALAFSLIAPYSVYAFFRLKQNSETMTLKEIIACVTIPSVTFLTAYLAFGMYTKNIILPELLQEESYYVTINGIQHKYERPTYSPTDNYEREINAIAKYVRFYDGSTGAGHFFPLDDLMPLFKGDEKTAISLLSRIKLSHNKNVINDLDNYNTYPDFKIPRSEIIQYSFRYIEFSISDFSKESIMLKAAIEGDYQTFIDLYLTHYLNRENAMPILQSLTFQMPHKYQDTESSGHQTLGMAGIDTIAYLIINNNLAKFDINDIKGTEMREKYADKVALLDEYTLQNPTDKAKETYKKMKEIF